MDGVVSSVDPAERRERRGRLSRDDWSLGALYAVGELGLGGFNVEALARRLRVTKGSFYWHFKNRDDLIEAALALWERLGTEDLIDELEQLAEPDAKLARLFELALHRADQLRTEAVLAAAAISGHPIVAPAYERVQQRRLAYVRQLYRDLGYGKAEARRWGVLAFSAYLGHVQLVLVAADTLPGSRRLREQADLAIQTLVTRPR
jgi:AcrR family transcriptional regulator